MPVIETKAARRGPKDAETVAALAAELRSPQPVGQPLIWIREMARGLRHVYVVWDRWHEYRPEARAAIIRETFRQVKGAEYEKSIAITVPATVPEAGDAGILPFVVRPRGFDRLDVAGQEQTRAVLVAEGGSLLGGGPFPLLRYATAELAQDGIARLREAVPALQWDVIETKYVPG